MKYLYLTLAFAVGVLAFSTGCTPKVAKEAADKAAKAAYEKGCAAGIGEALTQMGYQPNPEPIKAFCAKASEQAE